MCSIINPHSFLTMVVSVMDPKLLMKILQVTFTGGPEGRNNRQKWCAYTGIHIQKDAVIRGFLLFHCYYHFVRKWTLKAREVMFRHSKHLGEVKELLWSIVACSVIHIYILTFIYHTYTYIYHLNALKALGFSDRGKDNDELVWLNICDIEATKVWKHVARERAAIVFPSNYSS